MSRSGCEAGLCEQRFSALAHYEAERLPDPARLDDGHRHAQTRLEPRGFEQARQVELSLETLGSLRRAAMLIARLHRSRRTEAHSSKRTPRPTARRFDEARDRKTVQHQREQDRIAPRRIQAP